MLSSTMATFLQPALLLSALALANPMPEVFEDGEEILPPGYEFEDVQWEVQAFPGGDTITLNGTIEKVNAELLKINPDYLEDFPEVYYDEDDEESGSLARRGTCDKWHFRDCQIPGARAQTRAIREGIGYLHGRQGTPSLSGKKCGRVSCSYDSAIIWCNNYEKTHRLSKFGSVAGGAQCVYDTCQGNAKVKGVAHRKNDNWSVKITGTQSC